MAAPNMATITASIERSLQNCSLSSDTNNNTVASGQARFRGGRSTISESAHHNTTHDDFADNTLELNSEIRLPYYWEQCLDLKQTGEVYYINWRTGMKSRYDPRMMNPGMNVDIGGGGGVGVGRLISSEEEEVDNDQSGNDSEGSSTEKESSSPSPSTSTTTSRSEQCHFNIPGVPGRHPRGECESENESSSHIDNYKERRQQVLVVAGCKGCFMYFMVPKQVEDCPKCFGQLLHFDRPENGSP